MLNSRTDRLILKIPCKETHSKIARLVVSGLANEMKFSISEVAYLRSKLSAEIMSCIKQLRHTHTETDWITLSIIVSKKSMYFELRSDRGAFKGSKHYRRGEKTFLAAFSERLGAASAPIFKQTHALSSAQLDDIMTYLE